MLKSRPSRMTVLGSGAFVRCLSYEGRALMNRVSLHKRIHREAWPLPYVRTRCGGAGYEPEEDSHQNATMMMTWSWTSQPPEL